MKTSIPILVFFTAALRLSAQIEVASDGKVGIGTSSPTRHLTINSGASNSQILIQNTNSGSTIADGLLVSAYTNGDAALWNFEAGPLLFATANVERMRIDSSGNVGIGTSSPGWVVAGFTNLDVRGNSHAGLLTVSSGAADADALQLGQFAFVDRNTTSGLPAVARIASFLSGTTANNRGSSILLSTKKNGGALTDALVIDRDQNVGIGTTDPTGRLEVNVASGVAPNVILRNVGDFQFNAIGNSTTQLFSIRNNNSGVVHLNTQNSARLALGVSTGTSGGTIAENLTIDSSGNVGIGTTSPSQKLQVAGTVRATSFISDVGSGGYADFVFKPNYQLAALSEVEAHIRAHGHLPGVPSESQVEREGIDLAAMQVKLLQKVEELTLYVIEIKKENAELRGEVRKLRDADHR